MFSNKIIFVKHSENDPIRVEMFGFVKLNIILNNYLAKSPSSST